MVLRRQCWTICTVGVVLAHAIVAMSAPAGYARIAFADLTQLALVALAFSVMVANAVRNRGQTRLFWSLLSLGCLLWGTSLGGWVFFEVIQRREVPDLFFGDVILFVHIVPFMAAVALRPHRPREEKKLDSTLNFLMLLIWWVFLYLFIVFPDEYVIRNTPVYSGNYDLLYQFECLMLLVALGFLTASVRGAWKTIYWNLFIAVGLYTWSSEAINAAISRHQYATGGLYDIPFATSLCWFVFAGLRARGLLPATEPATASSKWLALSPRLAMIAILSLPILGAWSQFIDVAPPPIRRFRLLVTLAAMLVLGAFVFLRQYLLDRELVRLLEESHKSLENLKRLQTQVVQREKLASLGQLVAGAAHEINNPVAAILGFSDLLAANRNLNATQLAMAQKIGQQARRTRDLVSGLLSFAQQTPAEKLALDVCALLQRVVQMKMLHLETKGIRVHTAISTDGRQILGNTNQLMQCFLEVIGNAMDALTEVGGGILTVSAKNEGTDVVLEFSDTGPGMVEPGRVFDPFYTTKPIGKGTGLGLSATYGVVQDHHGQISCHNREGGGAVFVLRFPTVDGAGSLAPTHEKQSVPLAVNEP